MTHSFRCTFLSLMGAVGFLSFPILMTAQTDKEESSPFHHEVPEDPYVESPRTSMTTSPAYSFSAPGITTTQVNVDANGQNIVGDAANEPSIAVNPNNPNQMVIGWRQFNTVSSNFRQAGYGYTTNGGTTWTFPGVIEPGVFRSDPVLDFDVAGNFFFNSLTVNGSNYTCDVFKSTTGGSGWDNGTFAHGGDKQWMTIDRTAGVGEGNIYAFWTQSFSSCYPGFFTRSANDGASFESCISVPGGPYWGTLAVGPDGELYVCGDGFTVAKSTNAQVPGQSITWDLTRTVSLGGSLTSGGPNPGGLLGQAWIAVDKSDGATRGNVYLLATVNPSGSDAADVRFSRSTDGGSTWSSSVRINDDVGTSAYQWFGTMSVAPGGRIDAIWLDTRDNPGSFLSALYYSSSTDGGLTWSANEKMSDSFDPHIGWPQQDKIGDYFDMVSDDEGAHLSWAGTFNGEQDVYYSFITPDMSTGGIPCDAISSFVGKCSGGSTKTLQFRVNLLNSTIWAGQTVTIDVDGTEYSSVIITNGTHSRANFQIPDASVGAHTATLIDPDCGLVVNTNCAADGPNAEWDASEALFGDAAFDATGTVPTKVIGNFPNPFNPSTRIAYTLGTDARVTVRVYNMIGQLVRTLVDADQRAGYHEVLWDGRNASGSAAASGIYLYRLTAGDFSTSGRMLLTK